MPPATPGNHVVDVRLPDMPVRHPATAAEPRTPGKPSSGPRPASGDRPRFPGDPDSMAPPVAEDEIEPLAVTSLRPRGGRPPAPRSPRYGTRAGFRLSSHRSYRDVLCGFMTLKMLPNRALRTRLPSLVTSLPQLSSMVR